MSTPKHDKLIDYMTDAFWSMENAQRSIPDPARMRSVVACICAELRKQPRSVDDMGCLEWAADWLETRLEEDDNV
jgi:hypothetical protein